MKDPFQVIAEALGLTAEQVGDMTREDLEAARAGLLAKHTALLAQRDQIAAGLRDSSPDTP